jgi:plastocyanin
MFTRLLDTCRVLLVLAALPVALAAQGVDDAADTMHLTDEPGNWFRSDATGSPVTIIAPGDRVDFKIGNCCTNTRHTVTMLVKPEGSTADIDQDSSQMGTLSADFDLPGVYVLICKVHPYMTAVVAVTDSEGNIPDVTAGSLPYLSHLGAASLPALDVLAVMTTVAATDADKLAKWDILGPADEFTPSVPGVGEVWINTQFERVPGQTDDRGVAKPGTITVLDAATMTVEREIDGLTADGMWNNPHNMWANFELDTVYNSNWFGKWINKIDRASGEIEDSIAVGEAPTHIITIPVPGSKEFGWLTIPLSADNDLVKVEDEADGLKKQDSVKTGDGKTHPHGHWLTCGLGDRAIVPNVFKGMGPAGSISILDTISGQVLAEFDYDANDPLRSALLMPLAVGECHVDGVNTAYVANAVSGFVTVVNVDDLHLVKNIPVTLTPDGQSGLDLFHTLQVPIQTPVSPSEHWVATAVLSLSTVPTVTGEADHVAIIDTSINEVVAYVPTPAGTHGINWGAKLGGGYYAYVTNQHANVLTIIDPDPNGDLDGSDAAVVGTILLANGSEGAGVTDGVGGQGIKPLPLTHDGWIQRTVELVGSGALSPEVEGWVSLLTDDQKNPESHHGELNLTIDELVSGSPATFSALGADPGQPVSFLLSLAGTGSGPCFAALGGHCLGLLPPFQILLTLPADGDGLAAFTVGVPAIAVGIETHFQAVVAAGGDSLVSNTVSHTVQ